MRSTRSRFVAFAVVAGALLFVPVDAWAHGEREVGPASFTVGWAVEPAFVDELNGVELVIERGGQPVAGAEKSLRVTVQLGDRRTEPLALEAQFGEPGAYRADLIPTAPGDYTFHFAGTLGDQTIDQSFTGSKDGFDEVKSSQAIAFPARAPSRAELATAVEKIRTDIGSEAEDAKSTASTGRIIGIVALVLAAVALGLGLRRRA